MGNYTEQELKEYATFKAESIVIRSYKNGSSYDERRKTTKSESKIIESVILGGLLSINRMQEQKEIDAIIDACEFIGDLQIPEMNGYGTIYYPLREWCRQNIETEKPQPASRS